MSQVTFTYPCGKEITKEISVEARRTYGDKLNGSRPVKATIVGEVSDEFLYKHMGYVLNPTNYTVIYNGEKFRESFIDD